MKFYNVEKLYADRLTKIDEYFSNVKKSKFSIATFYRFLIPYLLLPQEIEKVIYLDSDIIVNLDIAEFWQIELGDKPFGAITRSSQFKDEETAQTGKVIPLVREGVVNAEDYLNSGVMFMNLKVLRNEEDTILAGMKFVGESPHFIYPDQDVLNYCFSTSFLKLPVKFNRLISFARSEDEWTIEKKIYHYAANRIHFGMDLSDP